MYMYIQLYIYAGIYPFGSYGFQPKGEGAKEHLLPIYHCLSATPSGNTMK